MERRYISRRLRLRAWQPFRPRQCDRDLVRGTMSKLGTTINTALGVMAGIAAGASGSLLLHPTPAHNPTPTTAVGTAHSVALPTDAVKQMAPMEVDSVPSTSADSG